MFCDFRKAFGLDPEYNKQLEESMQEAEKKALLRALKMLF